MAIRRVTGAVSPSELIFADANALGATYDGSGTTIERGETFTLPSAGTTAVSNGALRLEALKGDCTITNNGNSTLTNASGVDGTIVMRSGASDFPAFVRNSSLGSMSIPAREDFTGDVTGTINSNATFPSGSILKAKTSTFGSSANSTTQSWTSSPFKANNSVTFTPTKGTSSIALIATFQAYAGSTYGFYDFYKNASDFTETYNLSGKTYGLGVINLDVSWESKTISFIDPVIENSTSEKTYSISARNSNAGTVYIGFDLNNSLCTITMLEIGV